MSKTKAIGIDIGVLVLLVPIAASVYSAITIPDYKLFIPAGVLAIAATIYNHKSNNVRKEERQ